MCIGFFLTFRINRPDGTVLTGDRNGTGFITESVDSIVFILPMPAGCIYAVTTAAAVGEGQLSAFNQNAVSYHGICIYGFRTVNLIAVG